MAEAVEHEVAGQHLMLLPDRAGYWRERDTLLVADVHFGKAAAFRSASLPIPIGTTSVALARLDELLAGCSPRRIVFLGDLWHAKAGRTAQVIGEVAAWRERHPAIEMVLVEGNHDRKAGKLPPEMRMEEVGDPLVDGPFVLRHYPTPHEAGYAIGGHIHPCVELVGRADQSLRLPCFLFGADAAILPAFGEFTGCAEVRPGREDHVYAIAEGAVVDLSRNRRARSRPREPGAWQIGKGRRS